MDNIDLKTLRKLEKYLNNKEDLKDDVVYWPWYIQAIYEIKELISLLK